ncbi:hypothetical protein OG455_09530 [Kitasatospora sp. NBC_01287]|nr:hypothetical protein [Kitasatospora sp. NBC_01287]MCX4745760.1 hypothetical protein [Kitasatospora sp. NBC_01287]
MKTNAEESPSKSMVSDASSTIDILRVLPDRACGLAAGPGPGIRPALRT